jgi:hypothetical protein
VGQGEGAHGWWRPLSWHCELAFYWEFSLSFDFPHSFLLNIFRDCCLGAVRRHRPFILLLREHKRSAGDTLKRTQGCGKLTTSLTGVDLTSENTIRDGERARKKSPDRLSQRRSDDDSIGPIRLAGAVSTQAAAWMDRAADVRKSLWHHARPGILAENAVRVVRRARLLKLGPPGGAPRPI